MNNPVTIVIPVYGKAEFADRAVRSVISCVNLKINNLIVVNDGGPEKEQVKNVVMSLLSQTSNAKYFENETNLGFVESCNRAVEELDNTSNDILILNSDAALTQGAFEELVAVLNISERHAVSMPRTSHGAISSFPINPRRDYSEQEAHSIFKSIHHQLPRYSIVPTAPGFCILIRRSVIENYGLFDSWFSPGYDEENDFCLRINQAGYSTVLANHAFVFHEGSQSFREQRPVLQNQHQKELIRRYPYFSELIKQYFRFRIDPADMFSDYLNIASVPKVLIDCTNLPLSINGTSQNILSFLYLLDNQILTNSLNWEVTILASTQAINFYDFENLNLKVISSEEDCKDFFDVGVAVSPIWNLKSLCLLSATCSRIVVSHLDIIALRVGKLNSTYTAREIAALSALEWADCSVFISESAHRDVEAFSPYTRIRSSVVIPQGKPINPPAWNSIDSNFLSIEGFASSSEEKIRVFVIGNAFSHKQVHLSINALERTDFEVVALGSRNQQHGAVRQIASGNLNPKTIEMFYDQADVVVIPSAYEGYGLPIPEALSKGKPLIVFETETAKEVVEGLSATKSVTFFRHFSDLQRLIETAYENKSRNKVPNLRSLSDYNSDFIEIISKVLLTQVDVGHLRERVQYLRKWGVSDQNLEANHTWLFAQLSRRSVRWSTKLADFLWGPIYQCLKGNKSS